MLNSGILHMGNSMSPSATQTKGVNILVGRCRKRGEGEFPQKTSEGHASANALLSVTFPSNAMPPLVIWVSK